MSDEPEKHEVAPEPDPRRFEVGGIHELSKRRRLDARWAAFLERLRWRRPR